MKITRITGGAGLALTLAALPLGTILASPAIAANQNGFVEHCNEGLIVFHSLGNSFWAESGDAKWQLIDFHSTTYGTYYDKKTGQLVAFGPLTYDKTWAKGNQTLDQTCTASDSVTDPNTNAQFNVNFTASLRQVQ